LPNERWHWSLIAILSLTIPILIIDIDHTISDLREIENQIRRVLHVWPVVELAAMPHAADDRGAALGIAPGEGQAIAPGELDDPPRRRRRARR
jgi:alkylhydroperoxidase family enzyme